MAAFVDLEGLPKEVDGSYDWEYRYHEPIDNENAKMADTATRDRLLNARMQLVDQYERETLDWIKGGSDNATAQKDARNATAISLRDNYWDLDPYVRARSLYDRIGMIKPGGVLDPYAWGKGVTNNDPENSATETPDDVD